VKNGSVILAETGNAGKRKKTRKKTSMNCVDLSAVFLYIYCFIFWWKGRVMDQSLLLREGFILLAVGMLIVYAFLLVMIGVMSLSQFFERFSYLLPDTDLVKHTRPLPTAHVTDDAVRIAVAIATARRR
jgi:Na+-transporting methylmalonyl-CoA/oxaloacetate decarboxylase gamma subunit